MSSPTPPDAPQPPVGASVLEVPVSPGQTPEQAIAALALSATLPNAMTARFFAAPSFGPLDINASVDALQSACNQATSGNLADMEALLAAQAYALNNIFNELARMALANIGQGAPAFDLLMRLAFKAQAQCRCTTQALAYIKHPRAVAFVKQANIAQGPQQVNNGLNGSSTSSFSAENQEYRQNELLGSQMHGQRLDTGTTGTTNAIDTPMAAVGHIYRAKNTGGESNRL